MVGMTVVEFHALGIRQARDLQEGRGVPNFDGSWGIPSLMFLHPLCFIRGIVPVYRTANVANPFALPSTLKMVRLMGPNHGAKKLSSGCMVTYLLWWKKCHLISVGSNMFQPQTKVTKHSLHNSILCWVKLFEPKIGMHVLSIIKVVSLMFGPTQAPFSRMPNRPCRQWQQSGALVRWHLPYQRGASGNLRRDFTEPKSIPEIQKYQQHTT